jgi:hypothetical protein
MKGCRGVEGVRSIVHSLLLIVLGMQVFRQGEAT